MDTLSAFVSNTIENKLSRDIKLFLFTGCKSLFDSITKHYLTQQLQLLYDVSYIRQS